MVGGRLLVVLLGRGLLLLVVLELRGMACWVRFRWSCLPRDEERPGPTLAEKDPWVLVAF